VSGERGWDAAQEGAELLAEGQAQRAVVELEALLARDPDNEYVCFFLGAAHFELGHFEKALRAYVRALEIAPGYVGAMIGAGHALRSLGRHAQAIRMGQQVLARDEHDPEALYLLGASHFARGDGAAAEDYLLRFLAERPELEIATEAEGMLQVLRGQVVAVDPDAEPE
jgi:cytochrome c-type biogenesis protein CcmH/NrfG